MHSVKFGAPLGYWAVGLKPARWHRLKVRGGGKIEFTLSPKAVKDGYRFDTGDPIWVCEDNGSCPGPGSSHPAITTGECTVCRLEVTDSYSGDADLRYQLNVLDRSGKAAPIDPIIENRA